MLKLRACSAIVLSALVILAGCLYRAARLSAGELAQASPLPIPGGTGGIGFDDLGFSAALRKVIVPAGHTGKLFLVDPGSNKMEAIAGFSSQSGSGGGHGEGVTSADVGRGAIFATDRDEKTLDVVDPVSKLFSLKPNWPQNPTMCASSAHQRSLGHRTPQSKSKSSLFRSMGFPSRTMRRRSKFRTARNHS